MKNLAFLNLLLVLFCFINPFIFASEELEVETIFMNYIECLDNKNFDEIIDYFYFDRNGWDRGPVFGSGYKGAFEFENSGQLKKHFIRWGDTEMANYDSTKVEKIKINLLFYGKENRLYNIDAIISRRNYGNTLENKKRTLYYFQSDKIPNESSSWTDWKIYMISNISL